MGKYYNIIEAMFAGVEKVKDVQLLLWTAASVIVPAIIFIVLAYLLKGIGFVLAIPIILVVMSYCSLQQHNRVLELYGVQKGAPVSFVDWMWLHFRRFFVDLFCWYDKKLLIPVVVGIVLVLIGTVVFGASMVNAPKSGSLGAYGSTSPIGANPMAALGGLGVAFIGFFLAAIVWLIVFMVHSTRTKFGAWLALSGACPAGEALKQSSAQVKGQTLEAILPSYINAQVVYIAAYVVIIPVYLVSLVLMGIGGEIGAILGFLLLLIAYIGVVAAFAAELMITEAGLFKFWTAPPVAAMPPEAEKMPYGSAPAMPSIGFKPMPKAMPKK